MLRVWLLLPLLLLQSCSSAFFNRPVIEDKLGNSSIRTLAITADRKIMVVNSETQRFCAEPPQDFGQAIKAMAEIVAAYKREKPKDALGTRIKLI
ncbi:MAG: hypothetical protein JKY80_06920 [Mariprofundaceae bacterium]|nr:hypothetical protein [Mariprofundaceae bacterium]